MPEPTQHQAIDVSVPDPRWRDLYRIGAIACILFPAAILLAIVAYFIWPYTPGFTTVADIFTLLQGDKLAGLMSLDLMMIPLMPITIVHLLAMYVALKRVNESYALIALVFGLTANVLIMTARPLGEMVYLSDQYATATGDMARGQYLAAGEAFHALFGGTAWLWWNVLTGISYTISSLLMLRSPDFSRTTAFVGLVIFIIGIGFWIPGIGLILSLLGTFGGVFWFLLQAPAFFRLGWDRQHIRALASV